jgi:hypothetical protein
MKHQGWSINPYSEEALYNLGPRRKSLDIMRRFRFHGRQSGLLPMPQPFNSFDELYRPANHSDD